MTETSRTVEFALDRFEDDDGRLVVEGRWFGVSGRRFVRPVLRVEGQRRLIAVLEHKPWSAEEGESWVAAFAHDGPAAPGRLEVAPDVAVELPTPGPRAGDGARRPARVARPPVGRALAGETATAAAVEPASAPPEPARSTPRPPEPEPEPAPAAAAPSADHERAQAAVEQRDRARSQLERMREERDEARAEAERLRHERDQSRDDEQRMRSEREQARHAIEQLRTERDEAVAVAEQARAGLDDLRAARGRALAERDAAREEAERLRRMQMRQSPPLVSPLALSERSAGPAWGRRAAAMAALIALVAALVYLF